MDGGFRELVRKYCLESTIVGLKYFYIYPDLFSRCFWLVTLGSVLFLAVQLSWLLLTRFSEIPTRVSIENQFEPVQNLPYPSIALCSPNQITTSFMRHFNKTLVDGNLSVDLERVLPKLLGFYELVPDIRMNDLLQLQALLDNNRYTISDIMMTSPQSCDDFLKLCYFHNVKTPCSELFKPILTTHGLCCAFNNVFQVYGKRNERNHHFKVTNVSGAGPSSGLILIADYHPEDALDYTVLNFGGIKVLYTDYSEFPADDESILVQSSVESYHIIQATHTYCSEDVKSMPQWGRKCYFENERRLPFFGPYRNRDCNLACFVLAVLKTCNCLLFYVPHALPDRFCIVTSIPCIIDVKGRMGQWLDSEMCDCPRDCESRQYKVDIVIGNLDGLQYMLHNTFADVKINRSTAIMYFFFANSVYVKQKQETIMSLISFVSNIGGVFGLCLGCSGISLLEIIFYLYIAIRNYIRRKLGRDRVEPFEYCK